MKAGLKIFFDFNQKVFVLGDIHLNYYINLQSLLVIFPQRNIGLFCDYEGDGSVAVKSDKFYFKSIAQFKRYYKLSLDMTNEPETQKKKAEKRKIIKDFTFLLQIEPQPLNQRCAKYLLEEGEGELLNELDEHFQIVHSFKEYDYEGKLVSSYAEGKLSKTESKKQILLECLLSMRIKEKAWFNCSNDIIYNNIRNIKDFNGIEELDIMEEEQLENDKDCEFETKEEEENHLQRTGVHYEITIFRLQYKNAEGMDNKRKIFFQKKEEARIRFANKEYFEAGKIYKFLDDISFGYSKKLYSEEEMIELDGMNQKQKVNFMKCYFKMVENKEFICEQFVNHAPRTIDFLVKNTQNDPVIHFLNSKWLLKERYLDQAFKEAEWSYKLKETNEARQLMNLIREEKKNKGKIKVPVKEPELK